jgi:glycoprotein-N-acetylgalactosamine 3-beta-galactosyltransferase
MLLIQSPMSRGGNVNINKRKYGPGRLADIRLRFLLISIGAFVAVNLWFLLFPQLGDPASGTNKASIAPLAKNVPPNPTAAASKKNNSHYSSAKLLKKQQAQLKMRMRQIDWKNCSLQIDGLDLIHVMRQEQQQPQVAENESKGNTTNIICFIMTNNDRALRVKTVQDTWGKRCNHVLVASDQDEPLINAVAMSAASTYENLWNKLNETLHYIWDTYCATNTPGTQYDWIFKVDDDTYVVMQNLQAFLNSPEVQVKHQNGEPLIYGRLFGWPLLSSLKKLPNFFDQRQNPENAEFGRHFYQRVNPQETLLYHSGGAGYVMNKPYLQLLLKTLRSPDTLRGFPDEDMAVSINMWYQGVRPQPTRDDQGRERFHPESPDSMYHLYNETSAWLFDFHKTIGGINHGPQCCSPSSISFHHIQPMMMRIIEYQLYHCQDERRERAKTHIPRRWKRVPQPHIVK